MIEPDDTTLHVSSRMLPRVAIELHYKSRTHTCSTRCHTVVKLIQSSASDVKGSTRLELEDQTFNKAKS